MNQILITGEEQVTENIKKKKEKKVLPIKGITAFYSICMMILGICMVSGSVYAKNQINKTVEAGIKPEITIVRNDEDNTIQINVTHKVRGIKSVTYKWNDEDEVLINGGNEKSVSETINLIGGENKLKVVAIDENGQTQTFEKSYLVGNIPEIEKIEPVENGVKIVAKCENEMEYLQYSWDNGEKQKIEIGQKQYEGIINAPRGKHILKIEIIDVNGMIARIEREVIGDTEPKVEVQSKLLDGKMTFVIDIEDDENIKTVSIIHNGGEKQTIDVNDTKYHKEVLMTEGEENTIIVTAINQNELQKTRRIRFKNM